MAIVLGIDPGSRITGYGLIDVVGGKSSYVASGCIRTTGELLPEKLQQIFTCVEELIGQYQPAEFAIEEVFMAKNADSALKLGQARGVAILAAARQGLPVFEYSAKKVKQSVVGKGNAEKTQVQHMVTSLLQLSRKPQADAADALAIALCHSHMRSNLLQMAGARTIRAGRMR